MCKKGFQFTKNLSLELPLGFGGGHPLDGLPGLGQPLEMQFPMETTVFFY